MGPHGVGLDLDGDRASAVAEGLARRCRPDAIKDRELVLQQIEPSADRGKWQPVGRVLGFVPAGPETDLDAAPAHVIDLSNQDRQRSERAEGDGRDHRPETNRAGVAGETGQGHPCVGRRRQTAAVAELEVMVGSEDAPNPSRSDN